MRRVKHPEIIHDLGDGWFACWDSTEDPDPEIECRMGEVTAEMLEKFEADSCGGRAMNWPNGPHIEPIAPTLDLCGPGVCSECGGGCDTSGTCPSCGVSM